MVKIALYIQCEILKMKQSWQMGRIGGGWGILGVQGVHNFPESFLMLCADIFLNIYDTSRTNFLNLNYKSNLQYFLKM